jgi:hypothetical protein
LPGAAAALDAGLPPGNVQEKAVILPSGSLPVPANETDCPGLMVTSVAGLVMVAVGMSPAVDAESCTKLATDGTPAEFRRKTI